MINNPILISGRFHGDWFEFSFHDDMADNLSESESIVSLIDARVPTSGPRGLYKRNDSS